MNVPRDHYDRDIMTNDLFRTTASGWIGTISTIHS